MEPTRSTLTVQFGPAGSSRVCQQYLLLPLLLLLLIALLPRFHGTDQIYGRFLFLLYHHAFMEPTRSTLTVQFGPAGSSGDPFCSSWGPKRSKRVHQRVCQQCRFTTTLSWNRPDLRTLFVLPLPPRFHGTYQVYLDRAVWAGWQLWRPFLFLLRPKTVKKGHQRVCQQYLLLPLLLLLLIALLPRFHGTDQIYGPFLFFLYHHAFMEPTRSTLTVQFGPAGSSRVCQQYLLLPLLLLLLIALLPRFHGIDQIYGPFLFLLYHHAFMEPTRSTLTVQFGPAGSSGDPFCSILRPKTVKKGPPNGLSAVPTTSAAATATNCFTTTLSWNRPDLRTLFVLPLPPRFHGTYQVYLDRAVWAGWQLWRPFLFLLRPKTVKKGHQRVCQQYLLLALLLLLLIAYLLIAYLLIALLPHYQVDRAVWAGWQLWRPFLFLLGPKTIKKGHQKVCQQYLLLPFQAPEHLKRIIAPTHDLWG